MHIAISNSSNEPLYKQIKKQIKKLIISNELKTGEQLPPIRNLASDLEVSVITIRKAYEELEGEGFITSQVGLGTFVSAANLELIKESKKYYIEKKLGEAVEEGISMGLTLEEMTDILSLLYREEEKG